MGTHRLATHGETVNMKFLVFSLQSWPLLPLSIPSDTPDTELLLDTPEFPSTLLPTLPPSSLLLLLWLLLPLLLQCLLRPPAASSVLRMRRETLPTDTRTSTTLPSRVETPSPVYRDLTPSGTRLVFTQCPMLLMLWATE